MTVTFFPEIAEIEIPREGPYRVLFERLTRLVRYRSDLLATLGSDPGHSHASSELVRVRHMIKEVHRGVSINLDAKQLALRIDPGEPAPNYASL
jgi:hypothetical protein